MKALNFYKEHNPNIDALYKVLIFTAAMLPATIFITFILASLSVIVGTIVVASICLLILVGLVVSIGLLVTEKKKGLPLLLVSLLTPVYLLLLWLFDGIVSSTLGITVVGIVIPLVAAVSIIHAAFKN